MAAKKQFLKKITPIQPLKIEEPKQEVSENFNEIKIDKVIYSNASINKTIDRDFSELIAKDPFLDIEGFFEQYNKLFYTIPKSGNLNSHFTLIEKSTNYLGEFNDPRDERIEDLLKRIGELEDQLNQIKEVDEFNPVEENPYFKNGSILLLSSTGGGNYISADDAGNGFAYLMERGRKRKIVQGYSTLKAAMGLQKIDNEDVVIRIGIGTLRSLPDGPDFTAASITNSEEEWKVFLGEVPDPTTVVGTWTINKLRGKYSRAYTGGKWNTVVTLEGTRPSKGSLKDGDIVRIDNADKSINGKYTVYSRWIDANNNVGALYLNLGGWVLRGEKYPTPNSPDETIYTDITFRSRGTVSLLK